MAEAERPAPRAGFPLGADVTIEALAGNPHPVLRRLREREPVSFLPALGGWLVTRADLAERVLRDARAFTVDDPRFTTARVVGPSMLSLDGAEHRRHRDPFAGTLHAPDTTSRLAATVARQAGRLVASMASQSGTAELRRGLAGRLAVAVMADLLGLDVEPAMLLGWYDDIVAGVSGLSPGRLSESGPRIAADAFGELSAQVQAVLAAGSQPNILTAAAGRLAVSEVISNAAVLLFGGIETTEGMISNAIWYLLTERTALREVTADRRLLATAIDEALRLEPAAAVVDRYATRDVVVGAAAIRRGDPVTVSLAGANRDPAVFPDPDRFDVRRANTHKHLAFAVGPHFCLGAQLARLEASAAIGALLEQLPGLRLDPARPSAPQGLVFRKPASLHVLWER